MPQTCVQEVRKIIDGLCRDNGFILEEKPFLLEIVIDQATAVRKELEYELDTCGDGLIP